MFDAVVEWMGYPLYTTMYTGEPHRRGPGSATPRSSPMTRIRPPRVGSC